MFQSLAVIGLVCTAALTLGGEACAAPSYWDLTPTQVKAALPTASAVPDEGRRARTLRVEHVSVQGVVWREIDFVFGRDQRLQRVVMMTDSGDYDAIKARILSDFDAIRPTIQTAEYSGPVQDDQVMICEDEDARVSLTYVRPATTTSAIVMAANDTPLRVAGG